MPEQRDAGLTNLGSYRAFLVRFWQDGHPPTWRASAHAVKTGEIMHFAALAELFDYLANETIGTEAGDDRLATLPPSI